MMAAAVCVPTQSTCCVRVGALRSTDVDCVLHATQNREHDPVRRGPGLTTTFLPPSHAASTTKSRTSSRDRPSLGLSWMARAAFTRRVASPWLFQAMQAAVNTPCVNNRMASQRPSSESPFGGQMEMEKNTLLLAPCLHSKGHCLVESTWTHQYCKGLGPQLGR